MERVEQRHHDLRLIVSLSRHSASLQRQWRVRDVGLYASIDTLGE
jgi:hypothetical protein